MLYPTDEPLYNLPGIIPGPAFTFNPDGLVTGCNVNARDAVFGLGDGGLTVLNLLDSAHPDDREALRLAVTAALRSDSEASCEARILHHNRMEYLWHSINARKIVTGDEPSLIATCREITRCKQFEESLRISETKFKRLFDGHSTVMLVIDTESKMIIDANRAAATFYGWPVEELRQMNLEQLAVTSPEFLEREIEQIRRLKQKTVSARHQRADGSIRDVEASTSLIEIQGKEVFYCIVNDVTERTQIEMELRFSRSQLDFALEKSHVGWWSVNITDGSAFGTIEHARIFGYDSTDQEWSFQKFLDHVVPEDRNRISAMIQRSKTRQTGLHFECRIRRSDGEQRWIMVIGGLQPNDLHGKRLLAGIVMDVSDRKSAEIELRDAKTKFDLALKAARAGVWEMNIETGKAVWSNEIGRLLGLEQQKQAPSLDLWMKAIHPDDRQKVIDTITETTREAIESNMEFRVTWPDGSIHWLMSRGQPVHNANGQWTGYIGTIIDSTERRKLLESVRQREMEYRSLFENMPNGFAYCQALYDENDTIEDFVFVEVNRKFEELLSLKDVTGKRATQIIPGIRTTDAELFSISERIVKSGQPEYFDYFLNALQEWFSFSVYSPKRDYFIVIFDVITKRKQIEQSLQESENKFRTITEQISEIVFVTDFTGIVRYISPSIQKTAGYRPEEIVGHSFFDFLANDEVERAKHKVGEAIAKRIDSEVFELKYKKNDGSDLYGEVGVRYFQENNGSDYSGMIGVIRDISRRKKAEEEKKILELQLQKAERLETVGRLAGGIAHDFNNLLSPILGYAELGMLKAAEEHYNPEYYTAIVQASERARQLIAQILTFSKAHDSKPVPVKVQSIIEEVIQLLRPSIPANIRIEMHIDKACRNILIDPSKLHQMLVNLCTNALQATDRSNGVITIELREVTPGEALLKKLPGLLVQPHAELSISDNGVGMDKATSEHIFEPFFTTKAADKGSGLGLSVVHGIVTGYNGHILVESEPGEFTTFRVYLPLIEEINEQKCSRPVPQQGKGSILFVDDEQVILNMISKMLSKQGFEVCAVKNPREAIELFRQNPERFDLVITDLTMPELSGFELSTELKSTCPRIPIILMTGFGKDLEDEHSLNRHGICKILKKPVRLADLVSAVNESISLENG
ncbi:PAS domain S-box protein [Chlorobaculum thiosulfatiphilum]|uniref:histidine kinase n=1 Tax=Chlorobaculum thiosulfatiphilum TaxID=115852 RepID=A0A5C4S5Y8_CHLTI|nr:PAS domain S-box protein [Chlorobaculum thiosulfatiphilum]TNJ38930.1 PAS domain S-box protein [Chlorobaculum thiosulfatiphilum]